MRSILKPIKWIFRKILKYTPLTKTHLRLFYKLNVALSVLTSEDKKDEENTARSLKQFESKVAPINAKILDADSPQRISMFLSEINFKYFSGGYMGMLNFGKLLYKLGFRIRIIVTEQAVVDLITWKNEIRKYKGLENIFDIVEVESVFCRDKEVEFYANEQLVATSWWTAHIVESVRKQLNLDRFIYFIQEFEPLFYPYGSYYSLAMQSYAFPHFAVFSTAILRKYFQEHSLSVFSEKLDNEFSATFHNAVLKVKPLNQLNQRTTRKLLFYFRPEFHADRNMYEIGFTALKQAIENGAFASGDWEFYGIGSLLPAKSKIQLTEDHYLEIIPKLNLEDYAKLLPDFDIGLSLMLSPHPSLVPIEMCAAGIVTVTNTFANKTEIELSRISKNFVCAKPSIDSVASALKQAVNDVENSEERIKNSDIQWPTDWNDSFNKEFVETIQTFLRG
jgi:hypothetical protein